MYLSKIRVINYKSFRDSGEIEFKQGINIIVGQNSSGKTALLELLSLKFIDVPHRSEKSIYKQGQKLKDYWSIVQGSFTLEEDDINLLIQNEDNDYSFYVKESLFDENNTIDSFINKLNSTTGKEITLSMIIPSRTRNPEYNTRFNSLGWKNINDYDPKIRAKSSFFSVKITEENEILLDKKLGVLPERKQEFGQKSIWEFEKKIYRFHAERVNLSSCDAGFNRDLTPDCKNLAEVLQNTQAHNSWLYEEFNNYVSQVYPSIKWVNSIRSRGYDESGNEKQIQEIFVWNIDRKSEREDLTIPLSQCGTGIGQVLSILYVAVTSKEPRTIIIDEPNSFLHPGAAKKLIQILNKFPQHQYFISTHSPEVLSAAKPSTITRLKYVDGETVAESINVEQTKDLRETLNEIGVKFSDVFFSENILWVEGETEEKAFPLILEKADEILDVKFLPLVHTDDLRERKAKGQKHAKLVFEIYNRLSGANALTPPFVALILDKESSSQEEINKLTQQFGDKLKFIPRVMYENYLIDAEAITEILNTEIIEESDKVNLDQVESWFEEKRQSKFLTNKETSNDVLEFDEWIEKVHAANLLENIFSELSQKTVEYRKTTHSVKLTQWLLDNNPEILSELRDFLINLVTDKHGS